MSLYGPDLITLKDTPTLSKRRSKLFPLRMTPILPVIVPGLETICFAPTPI